MVEKVRNDLSEQTLALNRQTFELDKVKTDLAKAAQRTADSNALTNQAQLALMIRQTINADRSHNIKGKLDERSTRVDEARLTTDFAKLSNDLRPSLGISCGVLRESVVLAVVECSFKNTGSFRVFMKLNSVVAWNPRTNSLLPETVKQITGPDSNWILSNGLGSNSFYLELTEGAGDFQALFRFTATTDRQAITMTKKLSAGILTDEDLKGLATQDYTQIVLIKTHKI